ncbi:MAG: helix-turn-helix domain-containing protein [Candidatus Limivicinus sp.]|jgi:transcriptional regulator with XRE-family HTH domain
MKKTIGTLIAELRKENNMTQAQLAEKMGVTDKAVSKWERDLSCPDINSIPKLAEIL